MVPRQTLFTDARIDGVLHEILGTLPVGSGVVVREDHHRDAERIATIARRRGLVLSVKDDGMLARAVGAQFVHKPGGDAAGLPFTLPVHDEVEADAARAAGAAFVYVSPVLPTASHPGAAALGADRARALAQRAGCPAVALGGMDEERFDEIGEGFVGWAGISAFVQVDAR